MALRFENPTHISDWLAPRIDGAILDAEMLDLTGRLDLPATAVIYANGDAIQAVNGTLAGLFNAMAQERAVVPDRSSILELSTAHQRCWMPRMDPVVAHRLRYVEERRLMECLGSSRADQLQALQRLSITGLARPGFRRGAESHVVAVWQLPKELRTPEDVASLIHRARAAWEMMGQPSALVPTLTWKTERCWVPCEGQSFDVWDRIQGWLWSGDMDPPSYSGTVFDDLKVERGRLVTIEHPRFTVRLPFRFL